MAPSLGLVGSTLPPPPTHTFLQKEKPSLTDDLQDGQSELLVVTDHSVEFRRAGAKDCGVDADRNLQRHLAGDLVTIHVSPLCVHFIPSASGHGCRFCLPTCSRGLLCLTSRLKS